ncbi:hypothetical protein BDZ94DRAFT_1313750 [Collybia nuda]|uniref:Uncharacterized protein n=1 Tax=Collybia nuda TaxID=64659 RepID=A0A9P5XYD1_9AGAR|nr:hypothetical protein BDZ94DRAFT_1313750 [Collybia nuda]
MSRDEGSPTTTGAPEIILRAPAPVRPPVQTLPLTRQPDTWGTSFKPLPPPGEAMNRIWGTHENVQVSSSFTPPQISRRAEAGIRRDQYGLQDHFRLN